MNRLTIAALTAVLFLSACGSFSGSRLNPMNWFGRESEETTSLIPAGGYRNVDNRAAVSQVTEMALERRPGGAVLRATGLPPTQGWWDAELRAENDGEAVDGVLLFTFVAAEPRGAAAQGSATSREITAAVFLSDIRLSGAREIRVQGAQNARSVRR
jgi:hypothetical protein